MTGWVVPGLVHARQVGEDQVGRRVVARHRMNRRLVSVTYLSEEFLADAEFRSRFMVESGRLAQVRDASVARVHRYVQCREGAAVIADHVAGIPLRALLLDEGALATEAAVVVLKDTLRGLAAGHAAGLAHGDLKPEHVILTRAGRVRLVDFGLSTRDGRLLLARSTPFYLAPEQWRGGPATRSGDVYAATVTFFECLLGAPPFHADSPAALFARHAHSAPPLDVVPGPVRQLVHCGLAKDPVSRPSARGFLTQVEEAAVHGLGSGWERRGRRELSRLLAGAPQPSAAACRRDHSGRERPVRFAVVVGGALVLAAGLSSPVLPVGPDSVTGADGRPPVRALPDSPSSGDAEVHAESAPSSDAVADRAPDPQSAALAEPVGPVVARGAPASAVVTQVPAAGAAPPGNTRSPGRVPTGPVLAQQNVPSPITPTPRTTPAPEPEEEPTPPPQGEPDPQELPDPGTEEEPTVPSEGELEPQEPSDGEPEPQEPSESGAEELTPQVVQATLSDEPAASGAAHCGAAAESYAGTSSNR